MGEPAVVVLVGAPGRLQHPVEGHERVQGESHGNASVKCPVPRASTASPSWRPHVASTGCAGAGLGALAGSGRLGTPTPAGERPGHRGPGRSRAGPVVSGVSVREERAGDGRSDVSQVLDDHFLLKYRELLDAEDAAFDELEHACEEGDRLHFDRELAVWQDALARKATFLAHAGIEIGQPVS